VTNGGSGGPSDISRNLIYGHDTGPAIAFKNYLTERGNDIHAKVSYNILYNNMYGVYIEDVSGIDVWNNIIYGATGIYPNGLVIFDAGTYYVADIDFRNNIIGSGLNHVCSTAFAWENHFSAFDHNAVEGPVFEERDTATHLTLAQLQSGGDALNCFTTSPGFTSAAGHVYTLAVGSPCINAGVDVGLTTDYAGKGIIGTPDIGAYEFQVYGSSLTQGMGLTFKED
jgi:parallel beta-helix repeat protein